MPMWWFNTQSGKCEQFYYGGYGGNQNKYESKEECIENCAAKKHEYLQSKHIMERLTRASDYRSEDVEVGGEGGTFRVRSVTQGGGFHEVNFSDPSCTCFDFKSKLSCKHFAAVFLLVDGWGFSRLPVEYREGPNMTAHSVTSCASADTEDPEVLADSPDPVTEELQCSLQKTSEQRSGSFGGSICHMPRYTGPCKAAFRRFYYDAATNSCREFFYGGCRGNGNNFVSHAACMSACGTSGPVRPGPRMA
ncbi:hypothetical protein MTO96_043041 [Rhipicephalus appendiculatus]